ncbi:helix-turn-helix domain-containing protein [Schinkia azotoformans]|uniref:helix-turn-helix domain-containing protein n=1 Tax=Schinkia azotoformans TaxID=1454 RepID=UPI002DBC8994|nr:helix-turn-helix domain-containing protein [Schinkia azotoformans]MEC1714709.1 helix-turn-helix domain-containing protein [Schinkia azotoformans]MEC1757535.1 helix-turn-helix domain-containing protein [Schinkia azotoformans]
MTVKEAAEYLECSVDTVYRMARKGELPCFKIRSLYRFDKEFLDEWMKRQQMNCLENLNKDAI